MCIYIYVYIYIYIYIRVYIYIYIYVYLSKQPTHRSRRFKVYRKGGQLCVDRLDFTHLWGLDLAPRLWFLRAQGLVNPKP